MMNAAEYERATQRLAALKFLRDVAEPDEQARLSQEMDGIARAMAVSIKWPGENYARDAVDPVPEGYARAGDGSIYRVPSEPEIEALRFQNEMANLHTLAQTPDTRRAEMERVGTWPKIPDHDPKWFAELERTPSTSDSADNNEPAAEQAALEAELHAIHGRSNQ